MESREDLAARIEKVRREFTRVRSLLLKGKTAHARALAYNIERWDIGPICTSLVELEFEEGRNEAQTAQRG